MKYYNWYKVNKNGSVLKFKNGLDAQKCWMHAPHQEKKTIAGAKYDVIQYGCRTDTNMVKADRDPSRKINACTEQEGAAAAAEKGNGDKNGGKDKGRLFAVLFASGMTVLVGILLLWM